MKPSEVKLECHVTISRSHGRENDCPITIRIEDKLSSSIAVEVNMSLLEFAECVTGKGMCAGTMLFNDSGVIGKRHEYKDVEILVPREAKYSSSKTDKKGKFLIALMEEHEVDGWKGRQSDLWNGHRYTENGINVAFHRHVTAEEAGQ